MAVLLKVLVHHPGGRRLIGGAMALYTALGVHAWEMVSERYDLIGVIASSRERNAVDSSLFLSIGALRREGAR